LFMALWIHACFPFLADGYTVAVLTLL